MSMGSLSSVLSGFSFQILIDLSASQDTNRLQQQTATHTTQGQSTVFSTPGHTVVGAYLPERSKPAA
jgi:hypothetical protein